jgi:hypothetical protein
MRLGLRAGVSATEGEAQPAWPVLISPQTHRTVPATVAGFEAGPWVGTSSSIGG